MSYLNGKTVLPNHLLVAVQQYVEGGYIYIPKREDNHSKWGSRNNAKVKNLNRNLEILQKYQNGCSVKELAKKYFLAEKTVYGIVSKMKQNANEF